MFSDFSSVASCCRLLLLNMFSLSFMRSLCVPFERIIPKLRSSSLTERTWLEVCLWLAFCWAQTFPKQTDHAWWNQSLLLLSSLLIGKDPTVFPWLTPRGSYFFNVVFSLLTKRNSDQIVAKQSFLGQRNETYCMWWAPRGVEGFFFRCRFVKDLRYWLVMILIDRLKKSNMGFRRGVVE